MIVDASVAVKWLFKEDHSDTASALLARPDLMAPSLIHAEVANAIWTKRRRGELMDDSELTMLPDKLASILQTVDEMPMIQHALTLAFALDHPVYDCVYLALAEALDQELVTADMRFKNKLSGYPGGSRVRMLA